MNKVPRVITLFSLTLLFLALMTWMSLLLFSRFQYQKGLTSYKNGDYNQALTCLSLAKQVLPGQSYQPIAARDLFRIHTALGKTYYKLARQTKNGRESYKLLKQGDIVLKLAMAHDASSYRTTYWTAKIQAGLEASWPSLENNGGQNPYKGLLFYEKAVALRPAGITAHYELIRQLYYTGNSSRIPALAEHIARIFPSSAERLKKEPFYTRQIREKIRQGLLGALKNKTTPRTTLFILSQMFLQDNDIKTAAAYYSQGLNHQMQLNTPDTLIHLGKLYLKLLDFNAANKTFITALQLDYSFESNLQHIYRVYKKEGLFNEFIHFAGIVEKTLYPSRSLDLAVAVCQMEMGQLELAKAGLHRLNEEEPEARTFNLLAKIAEAKKDWNAMEISAQTATRMEPENSGYWIRLSLALNAQNKNIPAEAAATKAIACSKQDIYWYYGYRAGIRLRQKKYQGAVADWEKALKINPGHAEYYYALAKYYYAFKMDNKALLAINKAILLSPGNKAYPAFKKKLMPPEH